ncbi:hypothetical protein FHG87_009999 [Trinorchestia longiramus]|nr:hypothetical protein FHG87_009999 [Trinorchestia longiramus]
MSFPSNIARLHPGYSILQLIYSRAFAVLYLLGHARGMIALTSVSQSGPYRSPGGVEEMQGGGRRVRLEWGAYITV